MNILLLKGFNNYFNRIVKKYSTLDDYKSHSTSYLEFTNVNFNSNDGVATSLVVGNALQTEGDQVLYWEYNGSPDYLIAYETGDNENIIRSRWFVLESVRTTTGQYQIALKRDVLADHINEILNAPCFVEKGIVNATDNALLYNKESMSYNQIKKSETLLQDSTESGWIIGYVAKNFDHVQVSAGEINADDADPIDYIEAEDLPFTVSTTAPTKVIAADATKTDLNIMLPIAWVDARYGSWGTVSHKRMQSFNIYNSGNIATWTDNATNSNQPYRIGDGSMSTAGVEETGITASTFLAGGTWGGVQYAAMNEAFALDKVAQGTYGAHTTNIFSDLKLNIDMSGVVSDPTKLTAVIKKYAADPSDISGGTFGNVSRSYYVDYNKAIGTAAYNQMKAYYGANYNWSTLMNYYNSKLATKLASYNACIKTNASNGILNYNGKIVKVSDKYYKMYVNNANEYHVILYNTSPERMPTYTVNDSNTIQIDTDASSTSNNYMNNIINSFANVKDDQNTNLFTCQTSWKAGAAIIEILPKYTVVLEEIANEAIAMGGTSETFSATQYTQGTTYDAAFNMFAIPFGRLAFKTGSTGTVHYTSKSEGLGIARWLATALGSSNLYDLQILPYCPSDNIRAYLADNNVLDLSIISGQYQVIFRAAPGTAISATADWSPCSFIFTPLSCKGTFDINCILDVSDLDWSNALNYKVSNETKLVRLCSPNWGSMFEFSLAKNNGVSKFNVDYTYKPSQPYIHINPDFKFLYGQDWDDNRGLILGGDFSIQSADSAWIEYQNNNKNYQSIFNRQIENLDVNNAIARDKLAYEGTMGMIGNVIDSTLAGAAGGITMNPIAIAKAAKGATFGQFDATYGFVKQGQWLNEAYEESKDYATDMYGYNLRNIQARPNALARTEALNNNNKIWPVIEIYDCTNTEKDILINKIRYNGMTVMALGKLADYDYSTDFNQVYVKGQLVRLENIDDDFHVIDAIYQEVGKGFFVVQGE